MRSSIGPDRRASMSDDEAIPDTDSNEVCDCSFASMVALNGLRQ